MVGGLASQAHCPKRSLTVVKASESDRFSDGASSSIPDAVPTVPADADWRAFRAKLVASSSGSASPDAGPLTDDTPWAHHIPSPEQGCLLLASPLFFLESQTYFDKSVILLHSHGPRGSAGIIINRPTQHRIGDLKGTTLPREYNPCTLYMGGDVDRNAVSLLHGLPNVPHSVQIVPGVYMGGLEGVRAALAAGQTTSDQVKMIVSQAGWGPGQLEDEVARGVWFPAAASSHVMLQPMAMGSGQELWHAILQLMGGEFAQLSAAVKEEFRADVMGLGGMMMDVKKGGDGGSESGEQGGRKAGPEGQHDHGSGI